MATAEAPRYRLLVETSFSTASTRVMHVDANRPSKSPARLQIDEAGEIMTLTPEDEALKREIAAMTPSHEEFRRRVQGRRPPESYFDGDMERPW